MINLKLSDYDKYQTISYSQVHWSGAVISENAAQADKGPLLPAAHAFEESVLSKLLKDVLILKT